MAGVGDDQKTPLEHTLDLCVFAPLGFALEARSLLPKFIDRGRNQIVLARVVGKYAVRKGTVAAEGAFGQATEQAMGVLRLAGIGDDAGKNQGNGHEPSTAASSNVDGVATRSGPPTATSAETTQTDRTDDDRTGDEPTPRAAAPTRPSPPFAPETLAIPDYDSLSASQVVPRLESLMADELESVREYEAATRARKTILNKIVQLQST
jgi:hypothetical protein